MPQHPVEDQALHVEAPSVVRWLIGLNVAVYVLQLTVVSPVDVRAGLGFDVRDLDGALWTVGTHMFVHAGFWPLVVNVGALWLFGPRLEAAWGRGQFAAFAAFCGLAGWLAYMLLVRHGPMYGASSVVIGVMAAYTFRWPDAEVQMPGVGRISVRWIVAALVVGNLALGAVADPAVGGAYAIHGAGLAGAWLYLRIAGSMNIDRLRRRVAPVPDEPEDMPPRAFPRSLPRPRNGEPEGREIDDIVAQSHAAVAEATAHAPRERVSHAERDTPSKAELNSLLDKISAHGLDALTQAERRQLEEAARRLKDQ